MIDKVARYYFCFVLVAWILNVQAEQADCGFEGIVHPRLIPSRVIDDKEYTINLTSCLTQKTLDFDVILNTSGIGLGVSIGDEAGRRPTILSHSLSELKTKPYLQNVNILLLGNGFDDFQLCKYVDDLKNRNSEYSIKVYEGGFRAFIRNASPLFNSNLLNDQRLKGEIVGDYLIDHINTTPLEFQSIFLFEKDDAELANSFGGRFLILDSFSIEGLGEVVTKVHQEAMIGVDGYIASNRTKNMVMVTDNFSVWREVKPIDTSSMQYWIIDKASLVEALERVGQAKRRVKERRSECGFR